MCRRDVDRRGPTTTTSGLFSTSTHWIAPCRIRKIYENVACLFVSNCFLSLSLSSLIWVRSGSPPYVYMFDTSLPTTDVHFGQIKLKITQWNYWRQYVFFPLCFVWAQSLSQIRTLSSCVRLSVSHEIYRRHVRWVEQELKLNLFHVFILSVSRRCHSKHTHTQVLIFKSWMSASGPVAFTLPHRIHACRCMNDRACACVCTTDAIHALLTWME